MTTYFTLTPLPSNYNRLVQGRDFCAVRKFDFFLLFFFFLFLPPLFKTTEGVVVGFQIFAWAPKKN